MNTGFTEYCLTHNYFINTNNVKLLHKNGKNCNKNGLAKIDRNKNDDQTKPKYY